MTTNDISKVLNFLQSKNLTKQEQKLYIDIIDLSIKKDTLIFPMTSYAKFLKRNNIFYIESQNASKIFKSLIDKGVVTYDNNILRLVTKNNGQIL
ncbi:hypothetical protein AB6C47_018110 [Vibrio cyclitrophicus]